MASIKKRRGTYSVIYTYTNDAGEKKQRWETYRTYAEAHKRRAEIEYKQNEGTFIAPNKQTVSEFMKDFVQLYGEKRWSLSTYETNVSTIRNYIDPMIGSAEVQSLNPRDADRYIQTLQKTPPVEACGRHRKPQYLPAASIERIIKLLKCAFRQAVRWEIIAKNPFEYAILPKVESKPREIWTAEIIRTALDNCRDAKLYIAINLAFACSLRMGEILGLTWDNVHIEDKDIAADNAYIYIDKELSRVSKDALEILNQRDVIKIFPSFIPNPRTRLVLKSPKTRSSVRRIWLPKTLAYILREWKDSQDKMRTFLGDDYEDYGIVVAQDNGRPCDIKLIEDGFNRLKEDAGLPNVVFHSLRHSSTTYKLKLNHGDLKATQGDTGHAQIDMITRVYAHILDEDRKVNAQKFEQSFYVKPDLREVRPPAETTPAIDIVSIIEQLRKSPELAASLAELVSKKPC